VLNCPENKQKHEWWQVCSRLLVKTNALIKVSAAAMLTAGLPAFSANSANQQYSLPFWLDGELVLRSDQQVSGDQQFNSNQQFMLNGIREGVPTFATVELQTNNAASESAASQESTQSKTLAKGQFQGFAQAKLADNTGVVYEQTLLFGREGVYQLNGNTPEMLIASPSVFVAIDSAEFSQLPFVFDINSDGLSDIILPNFHQHSAFVQQQNGEFSHYPLPLPLRSQFQNHQYDTPSLSFSLPADVAVFDATGDGIDDVVIGSPNEIAVFAQTSAGELAATPRFLEPRFADASVTLADPAVQLSEIKNTTRHTFNRFEDVDADGIMDLVLDRKVFGDDLSEGDHGLMVMFGELADTKGEGEQGEKEKDEKGKGIKGVVYSEQQAALLPFSGELFEFGFADFDGDGLKDVYLVGGDLGASSVLSAVMGGGFSVDISLHKLQSDRTFRRRANVSKSAQFTIDMANAAFGTAVKVADVNGDGKADLLLQSDDDELTLYPGKNHKKLLAKGKRYDTAFNIRAEHLNLLDTDGDGLVEMVLRRENKGKTLIEVREFE